MTFAAATAALFAALTLALAWRGGRTFTNAVFTLALAATAIWATLIAFSTDPRLGVAATSLRDGAWFALLLSLIRSEAPSQSLWKSLAAIAVSLVVIDLVLGITQWNIASLAGLRLDTALARIVMSAFGLLLLENLMRNTSRDRLWALKLLSIGLGIVFCFNLVLEIPSLFLRAPDLDLINAQPLIYVLAAPLLVVSAIRIPHVGLKVHSSRQMVFRSATLVAAGVVMEGMALAALYVRHYGGAAGTVLAVVLFFSCAAGLLIAASSGHMRSRLRLFISENFFSYKYDYRVEWSKFIRSLSSWDEDNASFRVLRTLADLLDSPGGVLLVQRESWPDFQPVARWSVTGDIAALPASDPILAPFRNPDCAYLELADPGASGWSARYGFGWLAIALRYRKDLIGLAILNAPRAPRKLDWEDQSLISLVALQLAVYLVHDETTRALADARLLENFNRRVAFVVHDMKTSIGQLSLLARNAERFGHEPQFRQDMVVTIRHAVEQLQELMARLKGKSVRGQDAARKVDLCQLLTDFALAKQRLGLPVRLGEASLKAAVTEIDETALLSVLEHVVSNALDAAPGVPVELGLDQMGEALRISVQDRGAGMAPTFLTDELFRPLRSTKGVGLGIGAYQARETMRDLHGDLQVVSKVGAGTTVRLVLPQCETVA